MIFLWTPCDVGPGSEWTKHGPLFVPHAETPFDLNQCNAHSSDDNEVAFKNSGILVRLICLKG